VPDYDDRETFHRAKAGDRASFNALQNALEGDVRRFVHRLIGPSYVEQDIVQNAFLALYMNLRKVESPEHLRPFLFRVARNLCYDELRQKGRFQVVSLDENPRDDAEWALFDPLPVDVSELPDEVAHWVLLYREVQKAMNCLPELQRQALILYVEEDLTYAQIGEVMRVDISTVKSRIHHGRKNLLKLLTPRILDELGITV